MGLFSNTMWRTPTHRLLIRKSSLRYRLNLKDDQICGDIHRTGKSAFTSEYAFSGKLFCQNCGSKFRRASWGTGKNKQYVWRCINREQNGVDKCSTKTVKEKDLEQAFLRVMNREQGVKVTKFDEEIFRRLIEKVKVQSMVEVVFVFKTGVEVREIF